MSESEKEKKSLGYSIQTFNDLDWDGMKLISIWNLKPSESTRSALAAAVAALRFW